MRFSRTRLSDVLHAKACAERQAERAERGLLVQLAKDLGATEGVG